MKKNYELVCIFDPQIGDKEVEQAAEKYQKALEGQGAEIVHIDQWGLRKLAYTSASFKKRAQGFYVLYQFNAESAVIDTLEEDMKLDETLLRHLFVAVKGEFMRVPALAPESILNPPEDRRGPRGRGGRDNRGGDRRDNRDGDRRDNRDEARPAAAAAPAAAAPAAAPAEAAPAPAAAPAEAPAAAPAEAPAESTETSAS